jgi:protein MpaA
MGRVLRLIAVTLLLALAPASAASPGSLLGRSWDGRPIVAVHVGGSDPARRVLVIGCVHGTETAGIPVARALEHVSGQGIDLWIVPVLNPDGVAAGTRGNAHGVDLNRNFPRRWRPMTGVYASGPHPLSEREARIAYRLILRLHPHVTVWFHQHMDLVYASGGDRSLERRFARVSGLPYRALPPLAGSAIDWQNHALPGTTAFAAELPAGPASPTALARYVRAVLALARAG